MRFSDPTTQQTDICDFANLPAIHAAMEREHGRLIGFQLVVPTPEHAAAPPSAGKPTSSSRNDATPRQRPDIGRIPPLPRPKFLRAIAEFALGE
jgi:hypothetical protein